MKKTSVPIAKERLEASGRLRPNSLYSQKSMEMICKELYKTLSKYMAVAEDEMRIHITRSEIHIQLMGEQSLRLQLNLRKQRYKLKNYKFGLVLHWFWHFLIIGILVVGSANASYQSKQIMWCSDRPGCYGNRDLIDRLCMDH